MWKDLLKLSHPPDYGMDLEEYHSFSLAVGENVLQSKAFMLHHHRNRARQLPSPRDGCRVGKVDVQPGLPEIVMQNRVSAQT